MLYHSTRSNSAAVDSAQAVLEGLAPDGGLYMPQAIPAFDWRKTLQGDSLAMATDILSALLPDIPNMQELVKRAYTGKFTTEELTPTVPVGNFGVLELFRGPTSAFKDVALQLLPQLIAEAKRATKMKEEIVILTATSGDTGSAALSGFSDVEGTKIIVFYPKNGVSPIQEKQMVTEKGKNTFVAGITGNFDDAQTGVKNMFKDEELNAFLFSLGCYSGEPITVVSRRKGSVTVAIKDGRYNIDNQLAEAIVIA